MFGLGATLALAMLAGTSLTSCYDSEHLDITAPTVLDAPTYVVSGYVWDFVTGDALSGVSVSAPGGSATTDATGFYSIESASAQNGTVSFSLEGYISQSRNLSMKSAKTGVVSYNADCYLINENDIPDMMLLDASDVEVSETWKATEHELVDLVNNTETPIDVTLKFGNLQEGSGFEELEDDTKAEYELPEAVKKRVANFCKARFGFDPMQGYSYVEEVKEFTLPAKSSMYSVTLTQFGTNVVFGFTLDGVYYVASVNACTGREYEPTIYSNNHYHGKGHGHNAHGGVLNAGGGIFE